MRIYALALAALLAPALPARAANGTLEAWFLDVGQGSATLVSSPAGRTVLVDAGPPHTGGQVARFLRAHSSGPLDIAIATHPHLDHVGGMAAALRAVGTRRYFDVESTAGGHPRVLSVLERVVATSGAAHSHVDEATAPIELGDGTTITFLSPLRNARTDCRDPVNCNSIAVLIRNGTRSLLLAADIEGAVEDALLRRHKGLLHAQVLGVGHHGSNSATTTAWLRTVKPDLAVISAGVSNPYHHPHPSTLHHLEQERIKVLRTDLQGTIHVVLEPSRVLASVGGK